MKKVIIIAAGKGMRLRPLTNNCPKGLLKVGKKTIIQHQIDVYNNLNLNDLNIIVGYKKNKINFKGVRYFYNKDYKNNNILKSLFYAKKILRDECYISYSDIIFKKNVLKKLTLAKKTFQ
jgi:CTP:phosphocholine cytidylyltransferase-like protein